MYSTEEALAIQLKLNPLHDRVIDFLHRPAGEGEEALLHYKVDEDILVIRKGVGDKLEENLNHA